MRSNRVARLLPAVALIGLVNACGTMEDDVSKQQRIESLAEEARGHIDELAARLGSTPRVQQDTLTDCVPGDADSGKELIYSLRVTTEPDARQRLLGEIREEYEARGWTAKTGGAIDLRLARDSFTMGATVSQDGTAAAVSGTGGCIE